MDPGLSSPLLDEMLLGILPDLRHPGLPPAWCWSLKPTPRWPRGTFGRYSLLQDVSESVFQLLVDYIYHGTVKLRAEELQEIYEVSDMYQLTSLFEECSRFLARTVQVGNCLQVMWLADRHSDPELYTAAKHCAKAHLAQLQSTEEFLHLPHHLLTDIISGSLVPRAARKHTCLSAHSYVPSSALCFPPDFIHPPVNLSTQPSISQTVVWCLG